MSLLLPLPFMFSGKDWFFFFPFFTLFSLTFSCTWHPCQLCCIRVGFENKPQAVSGCGDHGDQSKESSITYLTRCWGAGGDGPDLEPTCQWSIFWWGSSTLLLPMAQPFPTLWFNKRQKGPFFSQQNFSREFHIVWKWLKLLFRISGTYPCTHRLCGFLLGFTV